MLDHDVVITILLCVCCCCLASYGASNKLLFEASASIECVCSCVCILSTFFIISLSQHARCIFHKEHFKLLLNFSGWASACRWKKGFQLAIFHIFYTLYEQKREKEKE